MAALLALVASSASGDDGAPVRVVACPASGCQVLATDAAGRFVLYRTFALFPAELRIHDTTSDTDRRIDFGTAPLGALRLTDDGRFVLFNEPLGLFNSHTYDTVTGAVTDYPVVSSSGVTYYAVDWSRDLRYVLYAVRATVSGISADQVARLVVFDHDTGAIQELPLGGRAPVLTPTLSPDGRYVAYRSALLAGNWIVDRQTLGDVRLEGLEFSGVRFTSDSRYGLGSSAAYDVTTGAVVSRSPSSGTNSPNGRYVLYACSGFVGSPQCVYDRIMTSISQLSSGGGAIDDSGRAVTGVADPAGDILYRMCGSFFVSPSNVSVADVGSTITVHVAVSSTAPCAWSARSYVPWIAITSSTSGAGSADVGIVVTANPTGRQRIGGLTIAGQTVVVVQGRTPDAAPSPPLALRGPQAGTLSWTAPIGGGIADEYIIEAGSSPGGADQLRTRTGSPATSAVLPASLQTRYVRSFVRIRAANQFGESPPSNDVVLNFLGSPRSCPGVPVAPSALQGVVNGSTVTLQWLAPANIFGGDTRGSYVIEAGSLPGFSDITNYITGSAAQQLVVPGVPPGTYYSRVKAIAICGLGFPSNEIAVTVD